MEERYKLRMLALTVITIGIVFVSVLVCELGVAITKEEAKVVTVEKEKRPSVVVENVNEKDNMSELITQPGFLNGFPEENLVEFKVINDQKESLRVFEIGENINKYLSEEKQNGKTEFLLSYRESKDGITNPSLVKIEKK